MVYVYITLDPSFCILIMFNAVRQQKEKNILINSTLLATINNTNILKSRLYISCTAVKVLRNIVNICFRQ